PNKALQSKIIKKLVNGMMKSSTTFAKINAFNKWRTICKSERMSLFKGMIFKKLDKIFVNRKKQQVFKLFLHWKKVLYKKFDLAKGIKGLTLFLNYCRRKYFKF